MRSCVIRIPRCYLLSSTPSYSMVGHRQLPYWPKAELYVFPAITILPLERIAVCGMVNSSGHGQTTLLGFFMTSLLTRALVWGIGFLRTRSISGNFTG